MCEREYCAILCARLSSSSSFYECLQHCMQQKWRSYRSAADVLLLYSSGNNIRILRVCRFAFVLLFFRPLNGMNWVRSVLNSSYILYNTCPNAANRIFFVPIDDYNSFSSQNLYCADNGGVGGGCVTLGTNSAQQQ